VRGKPAREGDRYVSQNGYSYTKVDGKWKMTHHIVAEEMIGRPIAEDEQVRFKSNNRLDLRPGNIEVVKRGKTSLRRRKAQLEARIEELQAQLDLVNKELEAQSVVANA